ncbi:hypothetical protein [Methylobacterium mesophilicum]
MGMPDDAYDPASIRVLADLEPRVRDPDDPVWRWAGEFLGLPPGDPSAPGGMPRGVPESMGEPVE